MLFASEVAAVIGENPFRPIHDPFEKIWQRTWPTRFKKAKQAAEELSQAPVLDEEEAVQALLQTHELGTHYEQVVAQAAQESQDIPGLDAAKESFAKQVEQREDLPEEVKHKVVEFTRSAANKAFGSQNEASAIASFEFKARTTVSGNNAQVRGNNA